MADVVEVGPKGALVCTVDPGATRAGVDVLRRGGSAADAAVAANAVLAVTSPHLCGMGGDLWGLVHRPGRAPVALNASGRAGSGVDAEALRAEGLTQIPFRGHPSAVPAPGCVDGWLALLERFGRLDLDVVLAAAIAVADDGFPASALLALAVHLIDHLEVGELRAGLREGDVVRRPGVADALRAVARDGRDGFYGGAFGAGLLALGEGTFSPADLARPQADWHAALSLDVLGARVWTAPPASQGYLALAILHVAEQLGLPRDDADPAWLAHLLAATVVTGRDRPASLHDGADGRALLAPPELERWVAAAQRWPGEPTAVDLRAGDTTYLCVRDGDGLAVSLIQSQAADFGAHLVEPATGTFLHNRGVGFSLVPGHPAELAPGRRPPSTLTPMLVTDGDDELVAVAGTMGGDSQPHLMAQHLARLLHGEVPTADVLRQPRWVLQRPGDRGFDLWGGSVPAAPGDGVADPLAPDRLVLTSDATGLGRWKATAEGIGLGTAEQPSWSPTFGHAHLIARTPDGWIGCADPRAGTGSAAGIDPDRP